MTETLFLQNAARLNELKPERRLAAQQWLQECWGKDLRFRVTEVYRTQERQDQLYAQGRTKPGPIVTWTLMSNHTRRLAADIYPLNCTHEQIYAVAKKYGITHPIPQDPPHYEFGNARPVVAGARPAESRIRGLLRRLGRVTDVKLRGALSRLRARLTSRT